MLALAMAGKPEFFIVICSLVVLQLLQLSHGLSDCGGPCNDLNDCRGSLICTGGRCNDDPLVGTHICSGDGGRDGGASGGGGGQCTPKNPNSPPVSSQTPAVLTLNDFSLNGDGGGPSECDGRYHNNSERIVALSTGWYANGQRCNKMILITASNGRSVLARVVDECDSLHGCDAEHGYQTTTCDNNIVDGSQAVWDALGLDTDPGRVPITWSDA